MKLLRSAQLLVLSIIGLLMVACATLPASNAPLNQSLSWPTRQASLNQFNTWKITGLISIRDQQQSQSANVVWVQNGQEYTISIFGPLGFGGLILKGQPGIVTLKEDNGQKFTATTPEELITETSHWVLPVSNLVFWIRGLPAPGLPSQLQFDRYSHLSVLQQEGWKISYQKYTGANQLDLPSTMILTHPPLTIKIVISEWK